MDENAPPLTGLQADSPLAHQIQEEIKKKLCAEYQHSGSVETIQNVLPEFIKVLVCNARGKNKIVEELDFFLKDGAVKFVDWLWEMLADRNPSRTHSAFGAVGDAAADGDEAMEEAKDEDKKPGRRRDGPPSARGFRAALAATTKEPEVRRTTKDREREERRKARREDRDRREGGEGRERRHRERRDEPRERGERDDRERRRRRRRSSEEYAEDGTAKPRKQFTRASDHTPPASPPRASTSTKFRITDNKGASAVAALASTIKLDVGVTESDRDLLTAQPDTNTRFTITMDKIAPPELPVAAEAPAEEPEGEKEKPWANFKWTGAVGGGASANQQKLTPLKASAVAAAGAKGAWGQTTWNGNMTWGAGGKGAKGAKGGAKGVPSMQGGKGRGAANLVWRPPGSAPPEEAKEAENAALQKKIDTPLAYHTQAYTPYAGGGGGGAWGGAGRGAAPRGNKVWVNPALAAKEASTAPAAT